MASSSELPMAEAAGKKEVIEQKSPFLRILPQEIRDEIYGLVFSSTRLTYAEGMEGSLSTAFRTYTLPAPHSLALLKTCRQVNTEIGISWISKVLFHFGSSRDMRDKLVPLPKDIITAMRHIRVCDVPHGYLHMDPAGRLPSVLTQLPGLQLDRLTILGNDSFARSYRTLKALVSRTSGWKELHYITPDSRILMPEPDGPLPKHLQVLLEKRDGADTEPSVAIYRANNSFSVGSIMCPEKRAPYQRSDLRHVEDPDDPTMNYEPDYPYSLAAFQQTNKEVLFVVKRGKHVDYQQTKVPVLRPADILPSLAILFIDTSIIEDNEDFIVNEEYPDDKDDPLNR